LGVDMITLFSDGPAAAALADDEDTTPLIPCFVLIILLMAEVVVEGMTGGADTEAFGDITFGAETVGDEVTAGTIRGAATGLDANWVSSCIDREVDASTAFFKRAVTMGLDSQSSVDNEATGPSDSAGRLLVAGAGTLVSLGVKFATSGTAGAVFCTATATGAGNVRVAGDADNVGTGADDVRAAGDADNEGACAGIWDDAVAGFDPPAVADALCNNGPVTGIVGGFERLNPAEGCIDAAGGDGGGRHGPE
jgi:hypothetical protein